MALTHNSSIARNGLVFHLDAASVKGSRALWTDITGNGNGGTLQNGVQRKIKGSVYFDGSGDFLQLSNLPSTYLSGDFTIEGWVWLNSQANQMFFNTIPHTAFAISLNRGGSGQTSLYIGNGSAWQTLDFRSSGALSYNTWHHIAVTRQNNVITIWHNGVNQGSTSAYMPTNFGTSMYIGTYNGSTGENLNGYVSNYRIIVGSAVYSSNFTPSTSLKPTSSTLLLTCKNGAIDDGPNKLSISVTGNTTVQTEDAMIFDGIDDYINCGTNFDNLFSSGISFNCWVKISSYSTYQRIACFNNSNDITYDCFIQINQTGGIIQAGVGGANYRNGLTSIPLNTWVNISSSSDYSGINVYLNGLLDNDVSVGTPTYIADKGNFNIGRLASGGNYYYGNLMLGNISVYNRPLSVAEIKQNFEALRGRYL